MGISRVAGGVVVAGGISTLTNDADEDEEVVSRVTRGILGVSVGRASVVGAASSIRVVSGGISTDIFF